MSGTGELARPADARAFGLSRGEPRWLADWRAAAWERWADSSLPHRAIHLWRYTDPAEMEPGADLALAAGGTSPAPAAASIDGAAQPGVTILPFERAASECRDEFERVLGSTVGPGFGRLEALNAAAFSTGVFVRVARGAAPAAPIIIRQPLAEAGGGATRVAVLVEEGAEATVVEELTGGDDTGGGIKGSVRHYHVSEVRVESSARVHHATLELAGRRAVLHATHRALVERGAVYRPVVAAFGGALTKVDTGAILTGEGAESEMTGFLAATGRQRFDHHTVHHHRAARTRSNLDFRTVLHGRARSAYTGLIRIETDAVYSEAYQQNRNLLLSENCRAESIPELEILNQEVQCKHGATVGPLDPEHLFYLMARAIPRGEAIRLVVSGHFESTLRALPDQLRESLSALLLGRLKEIG